MDTMSKNKLVKFCWTWPAIVTILLLTFLVVIFYSDLRSSSVIEASEALTASSMISRNKDNRNLEDAILNKTDCSQLAHKIFPSVELKWERYFCQSDCNRLVNMVRQFRRVTKDQGNLTGEEVDAIFYPAMAYPIQSGCKILKRFAGTYLSTAFAWDGDKMMCMDDIVQDECNIYSFGLNGDWTFEEIFAGLNCTIKGFDPTVDDKFVKGLKFFKVGIADHDGPEEAMPVKTFKTILKENDDTNKIIQYLKVDVEGAEIAGLPQWLGEGALDNVLQIGIEFHARPESVKAYINIVLLLMEKGFKLISHMSNEAFGRNGQPPYYRFMEVVFRRTTICNGQI